MLHLTKNKSKHLIKICNLPFLTYLFNHLLKAGYKELILVTGYKKERMEEFLKKYKSKNKVRQVNQFEILGEKKYGTACALECVKDFVKNENFLMDDYRKYGIKFFSKIVSLILKKNITDVTSCFRIYKISAVSKIIKSLKENQYYSIELIFKVSNNNGKIFETPIDDNKRMNGKSKKGIIKYLLNLSRVIIINSFEYNNG